MEDNVLKNAEHDLKEVESKLAEYREVRDKLVHFPDDKDFAKAIQNLDARIDEVEFILEQTRATYLKLLEIENIQGIPDYIKYLCDREGITLASLERNLGLSNGSIRKWAVSSPSVDKLLLVADYFGVSLDFLVGHSIAHERKLLDIEKLFKENDLIFRGKRISNNGKKLIIQRLILNTPEVKATLKDMENTPLVSTDRKDKKVESLITKYKEIKVDLDYFEE